jgi:hypothetical protein
MKRQIENIRPSLLRLEDLGSEMRYDVGVVTEDGTEHWGEVFSLELGQPLRSLDDALLFFETYRNDLFDGKRSFEVMHSKLRKNDSDE